MNGFRLLSTSLALLVALPRTAPLAAAPASGFSETTSVTAVEIPVQVTRDGAPVRDLKVADFEVYEGKKRLAVTGFDVVDLEAAAAVGDAAARPAAPAPAVALAARRHLLLLFDLGNSDPTAIIKAERAIQDAVLKGLSPSDLVAVATYSPADGTRLVLNFTSDLRQIGAALQRVGLPPVEDRSPDPLRLLAETPAPIAPATVTSAAGNVRGAQQDSAADYLAHVVADSARADREQRLALVGAMTRAYTDLARLMAGVSGRKEVVLFSQGFDPALLQGTTNTSEETAIASLQNDEKVLMVDSEARFGNTHQSNQLEKTLEAFRRADCAIQAINIGGLAAPEQNGGGAMTAQQSTAAMAKLGFTNATNSDNGLAVSRPNGDAALFQMAHDTGGELYRNFNDLGTAFRQILRKTSLTYVLTVQPENVASNGAYHPLRVVLKQSPRGTQVSARPGYYAPVKLSRPSALERTLAAGNELLSAPGSGTIETALLAVPFRSHGAKAYVPVLIEADGTSLLGPVLANAVASPPVPAEIYTYALGPDHNVVDFFVQVLSLDLAKVGDSVRSAGLKYFGHLELAPGQYEIRSLVRNGLSGDYGVAVSQLTVPDFTAGKVAVFGPLFLEPFDKWLMVREGPRGDLQGEPYPFMVGTQAYVPASLPKYSEGDAATLELVAWNWGGQTGRCSGRILDRQGKQVGSPIALDLAPPVANPAGFATVQTRFVTPKLAPGVYDLVLDLGGASGSAGAQFSVVESLLKLTGGK